MALLYKRLDVFLIQVLDPGELSPDYRGECRLTDMESGAKMDVRVDERLASLYQKRLATWLGGIERFCLDHGTEYVRTTTLVPVEDLVLTYLRQGGHLH